MDIKLLREKALERARTQLKEQLSRRDLLIIQCIKAFDAVERSSASLLERAEGWSRVASEPQDVEQTASFGRSVHEFAKEKERIEKYLETLMDSETPNLRVVCGTILGAKLIEAAGSLERLAQMPASAVQVLGAEKAFFAHLRKKVRPPKHGIIFIHPAISDAEKNNRGKIARKLAAKISIAAKVDFFKGEFYGEALKLAFEKEVSGLCEKQKEYGRLRRVNGSAWSAG